MAFVPSEGPLSEFRGELIVALSGDRAPFAISNSGQKLTGPIGFKLVRIDTDGNTDSNVHDFIRNVSDAPRSQTRGGSAELLERPYDVKVGPDGYLYVLDFGKLEMKNGKPRVTKRTGQVFRVYPAGRSRRRRCRRRPSRTTSSLLLLRYSSSKRVIVLAATRDRDRAGDRAVDLISISPATAYFEQGTRRNSVTRGSSETV